MSEIRVNKVIDEAGTGAVELTQGATLPTGKTISGSGSLNITGNSTVGGNLSVGGVLTYEDVTNVDSIGIITAQSGIHVTSGITSIKGAAEKVNVGSYAGGILTLDASTGTVFTHDLQGQTVGIVSITNFPVVTNSFHTVTVIYNQNSAGTANTTPDVGVSTNITLTPSGVSGFSTEGLVGTGTTVVLSTTAEDFDIVTYGIHYNGDATGTISNYKVFVTKSGDFRYG
ncbi:hypothetical protein CMO86_06980 [Candidatus Woesearchaeota archaeon]|nr:hypothetical protein [Candidatus Woesearchaeota archaeon]|tara:strand:- start:815 stop:1498 length:684 start_codon:yes stop_codon:yes gene_type:complete